MTRRMTQHISWALFIVLVIALVHGVVGAQRSHAADPPLFQAGQAYLVAWDCTPAYMAQAVSQAMAGGQPLNPCYVEVLTVQTVRADGWLVVTTGTDGVAWTVNPARMVGLQAQPQGLRAAQ